MGESDTHATFSMDAKTMIWNVGTPSQQFTVTMMRPPDWEVLDVVAATSAMTEPPRADSGAGLMYGMGVACRSDEVFSILGLTNTKVQNLVLFCLALGYGENLEQELESGEGEPVSLTAGEGRGVRRREELSLMPGEPPLPVFTRRMVVRTACGPFALTFMTPNAQTDEDVFVLEVLFAKMSGTCQLSPARRRFLRGRRG